MKKNIFGYLSFICGNVFLFSGINKMQQADNDESSFFALIFIFIALIEIFCGIIFSIDKSK